MSQLISLIEPFVSGIGTSVPSVVNIERGVVYNVANILTCDDRMGLHIAEACRYSGIQIPEEVAVLGVDNDETLCELSDPPLSSIIQDAEKGGYDAARLLDQSIRNGSDGFYNIVVEPK